MSKLEYYSDIAYKNFKLSTDTKENWMNILKTIGQLYKYSFNEQVLINAQRPEVKVCASMDIWNNSMNRYIKRGSKGIAIIKYTGSNSYIKYVFDYKDTFPARKNSRKPFLWEIKNEHKYHVINKLIEHYDLKKDDDIGNVIFGLAENLSARYYKDNSRDIQYSVEGSYLEELDEHNIRVAFCEVVTVSLAYSIMYRCGVDFKEYIHENDFRRVIDFSSDSSIYTLGTAVSELSEEVLREIEVVMKKYEREKLYKRSDDYGIDLQTRRGLPNTEYNYARSERGHREIREIENELSKESSLNTIQYTVSSREVTSSSFGDRGDSQREIGTNDRRNGITDTSTGQRNRPDGLGGTHEFTQDDSRRNNIERVDLQLDKTPLENTSSGVLSSKQHITQNIIDEVLRTGNNKMIATLRIMVELSTEKSVDEKISFIKEEYDEGGKGFKIDGEKISVFFNESGMTISKGDSALQSTTNIHLS